MKYVSIIIDLVPQNILSWYNLVFEFLECSI